MTTKLPSYPVALRQSKGSEKLPLSHAKPKEPVHEINKEFVYDVLQNSSSPISRRELREQLKIQHGRYPDLGTLCAPLKYLENDGRVSWIKMKCPITELKVKHYFVTPTDLPLGQFYDWSLEDDKLVVRGEGIRNV